MVAQASEKSFSEFIYGDVYFCLFIQIGKYIFYFLPIAQGYDFEAATGWQLV